MPESTPRQPKLRASCDRCGSAKLRCDRQHPSCGRCQVLEVDCVYGISRKSNRKPVRVKTHELPRPPVDLTAAGSNQNHNHQPRYRDPQSSRASVCSDLSSILDQSMLPDFASTGTAEMYGAESLSTFQQFGTMDIDDWDFTDAMGSDIADNFATPVVDSTQDRYFPAQLQPAQPQNASTHDCHREACAVFGSLSFLDLDQSPSTHASAAAMALLTNQVPLDHVLKINRNACERLLRLLDCQCARAPHLALLYASIFSRVLMWYQQAICTLNRTPDSAWDTTMAAQHISPQTASATSSAGASGLSSSSGSTGSASTGNTSAGSSSWSDPFAYKRKPSMPALAQSVAPTQMTMGSFRIDDQNVQAAMNIQLVSGEMKRAGTVVDSFASQSSSGHSSAEACSFGGVDSLYKTLSAWLRGEHSRTAGIVRSKLNELSDVNDSSSETQQNDSKRPVHF